MKKSILVMGNDLNIGRSIQHRLQDETTNVYVPLSETEALDAYMRRNFCLVIVDTPLLETDAMQVIRIMRCAKPVPIVALYVRTDIFNKMTFLETGATVCIEKPLDLEECRAQANALIMLYTARSDTHEYHTLSFGVDLIIDPTYRVVLLKGKNISLTRREFDLLYYLASNYKQVFSIEQIYNHVWGGEAHTWGNDAVKSCIKSLRRKMSESGRDYIQNVRGIGYRFARSLCDG